MGDHRHRRERSSYRTPRSSPSSSPSSLGWASVCLAPHRDEKDHDNKDDGVALYHPNASEESVSGIGSKHRIKGIPVTNSSVIVCVPTVASSKVDPSVDTTTTTVTSVARFVLEGYPNGQIVATCCACRRQRQKHPSVRPSSSALSFAVSPQQQHQHQQQ